MSSYVEDKDSMFLVSIKTFVLDFSIFDCIKSHDPILLCLSKDDNVRLSLPMCL